MDGNTPVPRKIFSESKNYASSGKVMLISVIVCFTVAIIVVLFHFYYRYFTFHRRPSSVHRLENSSLTPKSLPRAVLQELPDFVYSTGHDSLECAICLTEFQDNQSGRILPKCSHVFHLQCIDTWFLSHSDCPLCRAMVQLAPNSLVTGPRNSSGSYQDNSGSGTGETGGLTSSEHFV